jgi:ATP dependent DNA ligase domain
VDGWRILAYKDGDDVRLVSRHGVDHTKRFADVARAISKLSPRVLVLDAEVAVYDQQLRSRFNWLREPDPAAGATSTVYMGCSMSCTAQSIRLRSRVPRQPWAGWRDAIVYPGRSCYLRRVQPPRRLARGRTT